MTSAEAATALAEAYFACDAAERAHSYRANRRVENPALLKAFRASQSALAAALAAYARVRAEPTSEFETLRARVVETAALLADAHQRACLSAQLGPEAGRWRDLNLARQERCTDVMWAVEAARKAGAIAPTNDEYIAAAIAQEKQETLVTSQATTSTRLLCHAGRDGECHWRRCPQLRDNEPNATGRHCPLDKEDEEES